MLSIFRYPGGKTRKKAKESILKHAPKEFSEYREPFVGGGGIFFEMDPDKLRWINDKDEYLISVYQALRDRPEQFIKKCREIPTFSKKNKDQEYERLKKEFSRIAFDENEDPAFRYFFVNRTVFAGRVNYERKSRLYFSKPWGWTESVLNRLETAAIHLKNTKITCGDYENLLMAPGENVWIYCDPPYVKPFTSSSLLYRHNFTNEDHERLADIVNCSPHKVCISYEDHPLVRSLYKKFTVLENEWLYCGTWSPNLKKRTGKELLILNY